MAFIHTFKRADFSNCILYVFINLTMLFYHPLLNLVFMTSQVWFSLDRGGLALINESKATSHWIIVVLLLAKKVKTLPFYLHIKNHKLKVWNCVRICFSLVRIFHSCWMLRIFHDAIFVDSPKIRGIEGNLLIREGEIFWNPAMIA